MNQDSLPPRSPYDAHRPKIYPTGRHVQRCRMFHKVANDSFKMWCYSLLITTANSLLHPMAAERRKYRGQRKHGLERVRVREGVAHPTAMVHG